MTKIVFFVNSIQNQRCVKRINEFVSKGVDVEVYAYSRQKEKYCNFDFPLTVLENIDNSKSYVGRLPVLFKSIKTVLRTRDNKPDDVFYIFGLDIAMVIRVLDRKHQYVYEESDLVHTYIGNSIIKKGLEYIDKRIIQSAFRAVFTSEGFVKYHFGDERPSNIVIIPNKLNPSILELDWCLPKSTEEKKIRVAFVGKPRFKSVVNFARVLCESSLPYEFHIYGGPILEELEGFRYLERFQSFFYHGPFKNPDDLPKIYSSVDVLLSTYDIEYENVRYAEPNKIYEALFFRTPIIVSSGTFLAEKVEKMGIGYSLDPLDDSEVLAFLSILNKSSILAKSVNCSKYDRVELIDSNASFISSLLSV